MAQTRQHLAMILHLARASQQRRRPFVRDKLLLIAGAEAIDVGLDQIAEYCRHKILEHNPGHLLRRFSSFAAARHDEHFLAQLRQAQRAYSPEKVEHMLATLGIQLGRERDTYFTDHEYAASLLGTTPDELESLFGNPDGLPNNVAEAHADSALNPYQAPADGYEGVETRQQRRTTGRFPLSIGVVVLLTLGIPILLGIVLSLLLPLLRLFFRGP